MLKEWGFARSSSTRAEILERSAPRTLPRTKQFGDRVFWPEGANPKAYRFYRVPAEGEPPMRKIEEIPVEELRNAMAAILEQFGAVPQDSLYGRNGPPLRLPAHRALRPEALRRSLRAAGPMSRRPGRVEAMNSTIPRGNRIATSSKNGGLPLNPDQIRFVLDSLFEGVCTVDRDWTITSFNRSAQNLTGLSADEALGAPFSTLMDCGMLECRDLLRGVMGSGQTVRDVATRIMSRDGGRIPRHDERRAAARRVGRDRGARGFVLGQPSA
ncbi:MAG: PAS domain-containing protein [Atribacter sp.]|uniref:PAS domain-containing protein n=1 Tax=Atribacter sp. TaxID=2847780 RepID=UPI003D954150